MNRYSWSLYALVAVVLTASPTNAQVTVTVGPDQTYTTIGSAIADQVKVPNGSRIEVLPGSYPEAIVLQRPLAVVGTGGSASTTLDGTAIGGIAVTVSNVNGVEVTGFTIDGFAGALNANSAVKAGVINDIVVTGHSTYPISIYPEFVDDVVPGVTLTQEGSFDAVRILPLPSILDSVTWPLLQSGFCYVFASAVWIQDADAPILTIESGNVVKIPSSGFISIGGPNPGSLGALVADGVLFTSIHDDGVQNTGDTSGDGPTGITAANRWANISINRFGFANTVIENCTINHGGKLLGAVTVLGGDPIVRSNVFLDNRLCLFVDDNTIGTFIESNSFEIVTENAEFSSVSISAKSVEEILTNNNTFAFPLSGSYNAIGVNASNLDVSTTWPLPSGMVYACFVSA